MPAHAASPTRVCTGATAWTRPFHAVCKLRPTRVPHKISHAWSTPFPRLFLRVDTAWTNLHALSTPGHANSTPSTPIPRQFHACYDCRVSTTTEVLERMQVQSGYNLCVVRTDNGGEYISNDLARYFRARGIEHQTTVAYTPQQNGKAERLNRTLLDRMRAMLIESGLPELLWAEAMSTANYIRK